MKPRKESSPVHPDLADCHPIPSVAHLFRRHWFLQSPMYFIRWIYAVFYSLYLLLVLRDPTDSDIVEYVENTTLAMLIRLARNGRPEEYDVTVGDCKLRASGGYKLKSWSLTYKKGNGGAEILRFSRNGVEIGDRSQIFSTVFLYHVHSLHTKSHVFSNGVARHIVENDVKTLLESSYTSMPLHNALLHSCQSPLEGTVAKLLGYICPCTRESVVEESRNMSALKGHQTKQCWEVRGKDTVAYKLFRLRQALQVVMKRHAIDQNWLEALFNHTIVHSVDHYLSTQQAHLRFSLHPWDAGCTTYQAFNTNMFRVLISFPTLNPLAPNTLRTIHKPFYQDLYRELKKIDPKIADTVTASVMY
ncbi:Hypp4016 [Branchiostoma lanceolatum]|uniref:Hypp4016 protein n=1 Tax=Branchiostoma lanceolatum TaxID=7740 RepID=A0A8K0EWD0_BRALA|nr:Hypp4016 [Branchiostoma lanceolatum]